MPVTFNTLQIGTQYERPYLAQVWGYKDFHAIAKGAVTPKETPFIILFITREKQDFQTQYGETRGQVSKYQFFNWRKR